MVYWIGESSPAMAEPSKLVKTEQFTQIDLDVPSGDLTAMENLILMV